MTDEQGSNPRYQWFGPVRPAAPSHRRSLVVAGVAVGLLVAGLALQGPSGSGLPLTSPSPLTSRTGDASRSAGGSVPGQATGATGALASPVESLAVTGVLPEPDATAPSGAPAVPGLTVQGVVEAASSIGMVCDSASLDSGLFWLTCEGGSAAGHARYVLSAYYTALDAVAELQLEVDPISLDLPLTDLDAARRPMLPILGLVGAAGIAGQYWIGDSTCTGYPSCVHALGGIATMVVVGPGDKERLVIYPTPSEPAPQPSATIGGELPQPDATLPPGAAIVPDLSPAKVAATAAALGLSCRSGRGIAMSPDGYTMLCEGQDPRVNASYRVTASFWTLTAVSWLDVTVSSMTYPIPIVDPTAAARVLMPFALAVSGPAAWSWASTQLDDPQCAQNVCSADLAGVRIEVQWGSAGSRGLTISPPGS